MGPIYRLENWATRVLDQEKHNEVGLEPIGGDHPVVQQEQEVLESRRTHLEA